MSKKSRPISARPSLETLLAQSEALHKHLCPRQVLGVRMGILAGEVLGLPLPQDRKRLLTIVETDGCFADGVSVSTNCWVGRRTLRVEDYGKVGATFVDTKNGNAIRISPAPDVRERASTYAPEGRNRWEKMLLAYQKMPAELLLHSETVELKADLTKLLSHPGIRTVCTICQEEIINEREVVQDDAILCRACAGESYYLVG